MHIAGNANKSNDGDLKYFNCFEVGAAHYAELTLSNKSDEGGGVT